MSGILQQLKSGTLQRVLGFLGEGKRGLPLLHFFIHDVYEKRKFYRFKRRKKQKQGLFYLGNIPRASLPGFCKKVIEINKYEIAFMVIGQAGPLSERLSLPSLALFSHPEVS